MAETLRNEIEKILCRGCGIPENERHCNTCCSIPAKINDVCEAISKTAQGMTLVDRTKYFFPFLAQEVALNQRAECQAYWQKELK